MQLHFAGKNLDITPAIKTFATEKLQSLTKRFHTINKINITLSVENINHIAEGTVFLKGVEIHASATENDMYKAIATMIERLLGQLNKHQDKLIDSHH